MWSHPGNRAKQPPRSLSTSRSISELGRLILLLAACVLLLSSGNVARASAGPSAQQQAERHPQQHHNHNQQVSQQGKLKYPDSKAPEDFHQTTRPNNEEAGPTKEEGPIAAPIYLESMADLDHLAYLAMRNYNLTDERLLQSSWLVGSSSSSSMALGSHKQQDDDSGLSILSSSGTSSDLKGRLALMLESFMLHLRNGHLRRMSLEELDQVVVALNLTEPASELRRRRAVHRPDASSRLSSAPANRSTANEAQADPGLSQAPSETEPGELVDVDGELRCSQLVTLYRHELLERLKNQAPNLQSRVEYESNPNSTTNDGAAPQGNPPTESIPTKLPLLWVDETGGALTSDNKSTSAAPSAPGEPALDQAQVDEMRLMELCKLAVVCRSSEELVELISRPWRTTAQAMNEADGESTAKRLEPRAALFDRRASSPIDSIERETSGPGGDSLSSPVDSVASDQQVDEGRGGFRRRNLRDSLSMSLAKLCPLVLFPLHEDDGKCMVRRDDRPPLVTVWAFATLFVTIVCFCSLIGLSITPLLGQSPADSSGGSEASGPAAGFERRDERQYRAVGSHSPNGIQGMTRQQHKASLTLFEGLAVGSLVGSALFSLIPQAFELQERESNQGFLLKAFIIFSGIYLFFLSERIMRIILDTRQKRKKKKRVNHRSSTTAAGELPAHLEAAHHHLHLSSHAMNHNTHHSSSFKGTAGSSRQTTSTSQQQQQRPSTSSRGSGSRVVTMQNEPGLPKTRRRQGGSSLVDAHQQQQTASSLKGPRGTQPGKRSHSSVTQPAIMQQQVVTGKTRKRKSAADVEQMRQIHEDGMGQGKHQSRDTTAAPLTRREARKKRASTGSTRHLHQHHHQRHSQQRKQPTSVKQRRKQNTTGKKGTQKSQNRHKSQTGSARHLPSQHARLPHSTESDPDDYYHHDLSGASSSTSSTSSSSTSSFSSYALNRRRARALAQDGLVMATMLQTEDSRADYSSSSSPSQSLSKCSSCSSFDRDFCGAVLNPSDSDDDNDQRRAVSKQMSEISRRFALQQQQQQQQHLSTSSPATRTTFNLEQDSFQVHQFSDWGNSSHLNAAQEHHADMRSMNPIHMSRGGHFVERNNNQKQDISTVAWMIVLGDGLHNFIDGISIGAAFSESILSGVSISVAVICEEFPHELGDFAVLVSSGMTVRQALGYNFLSACTCYLGMAVGIILGDVNDGASYISALAAGVFLYIALVDMMGELSAALESSSRDSIARTLKLLLLQNVGIAIGISIIFVLSFIDF